MPTIGSLLYSLTAVKTLQSWLRAYGLAHYRDAIRQALTMSLVQVGQGAIAFHNQSGGGQLSQESAHGSGSIRQLKSH